MYNPGDLVRVFPEFLDHEDEPDLGVIVGPVWDTGKLMNGGLQWWIVLRGEKLIHHPEDTISPVREAR
jgi:hypothetical protein